MEIKKSTTVVEMFTKMAKSLKVFVYTVLTFLIMRFIYIVSGIRNLYRFRAEKYNLVILKQEFEIKFCGLPLFL